MKRRLFFILALTGGSPSLIGAVLDPDALRAWNEYVAGADLRIQPRLRGELPFLWTDESAERGRRLRSGMTVVAPVISNGFKSVHNALIHHWIGAVFISHGTLQQLAGTLSAYSRYKDFYRPFIAQSKLCAATPSGREFSLVFQYRTTFGSFVYEAQYAARDFTVDPQRSYSIANATQVREINGYGTADERALPPGSGAGLVWRLHSIARYQERDSGVYLELEALALTRGIPGPLRWLVAPMVKHMSFASLESALQKTRYAVWDVNAHPELLAGDPGVNVTPSGSSK
jgi:hypothetical protein